MLVMIHDKQNAADYEMRGVGTVFLKHAAGPQVDVANWMRVRI
jgi:hypothetical protein